MRVWKILSNNTFMLKYIFRYCPSQIAITIIFSIINSVNCVANVLVTKLIFDALEHRQNPGLVLAFVIFAIIVGQILSFITSALSKWFVAYNRYRLHSKMQLELFKKTMLIGFDNYDDPSFFDKFSIALSQSDTRALDVLDSFTEMVSAMLSITAIISVLAVLSPFLIVLTLICVLFTLSFQCFSYRIAHDSMEESEPENRKMNYIQRLFYQRSFAQEIRFNASLFEVMEKEYQFAISNMLQVIKKYAPRFFFVEAGGGVTSSTMRGISICYLVSKVLNGKMSIGTYAAASNGCSQLYNSLCSVLNSCFQFYNHSLYIDNFRSFIMQNDTSCRKDKYKLPGDHFTVTLDSVYYSYPGQNGYAVEDISFSITPGSRVVIVGENGSGKTTLMKLLAGLYTPSRGSILINGIPLGFFNSADYINMISIVSQDYQIFALSIAANILMKPYSAEYEDSIWSALEFVGLKSKVEQLPNGFFTVLTREFDGAGTLLSGGELQRLVIARAYLKNNKIMILDEPTSSLDHESGYDLMKAIMELPRDLSIIIITHDHELIELADKVLLMENGRIAK